MDLRAKHIQKWTSESEEARRSNFKGNPNYFEKKIRGKTLRNQLIVAYTLEASLHISVVSEEGVDQGVCIGGRGRVP